MADWFRSWHGAPMDPKWLTIAHKASVSPALVATLAWALLDTASQAEDRGSVAGFDVDTFCIFFQVEEREVLAALRVMEARKFIIDGRLTNWEKRQPVREDNSTDRVRAFREREKAERAAREANETKRNEGAGHETTTKRSETQRNDQSRADTETETDPEQQKPRGRAPDLEALGERLLAAAGWRHDQIPDGMRALAPILRLMDAGCDLERDILPTVQRLAARGARPKSWSYFDEAIIEARDSRLRPVPEPSQAAPGQGPSRPRSRADDDMERQRAILARIEAAAATKGDAA